jgi:hypothetical protein
MTLYLEQPLTKRQAAALDQVQQAAASGAYLSRSATDTAALDTIAIFTTYNPNQV